MTTKKPQSEADTRPFYRTVGIEVTEAAEGESKATLTNRYDIENSRGDVHGGAIATLIDAAIGVATRAAYTEGEGAATVSLTVNYVSPGRGTLTARGHVVRAGRSIASVEATVTDADGNVVAHGIATMRIVAVRK